MDVNMEELEKRMGIKIEAVRDMMLDRFSGVDQKLTAIEQLLKKIIEPKSHCVNPPENRWNLTGKNMVGGRTESSKNQDNGKKAAIGGGDGGPSHESRPKKPLQPQISSDGDGQETDYQILGPPRGFHLGDGGIQGPSHESGPKKPLQAQISSHESGPKKPLQAQISSDNDDQETDYQIQGPPGGLHLCDEGIQGSSHESGPKIPLQAQFSSDGDDQATDYQTLGPPGGLHLGDEGREGPSHESGPMKPLQAQISSDGDHQETDYQILGPPRGLHLGDGGRQGPLHESGAKKPLQAQISSDGDDQVTDYQILCPPGGLHLGDQGRQGPAHESGPKKPLQAQISSHESGPNKPLQAKISSDGDDQETDHQIRGPPGGLHLGDRGRHGPPWEAGSSCGWVGLYTPHYSTDYPPEPNYSFGTDFCGRAWRGLQETDFSKKNGPHFGSHEFTFKDQLVNKYFVEGCPETQRDRGPEGFRSKVVNADVTGWVRKNSQKDTEKGLDYSGEKGVKTGQDGIFKEGGNKPRAQIVTNGSNVGRPKIRTRKRKANKAVVTGTKNSQTGSSDKHVVKMGQGDSFKNSSMSDQWGKMADKTDAGGEEEQTGLWVSMGKKEDEKTDVLLQDSLKTDEWTKKDSDSWDKAIQNDTNCKWVVDWSKLVEAKTDSQHGSGAPWGKKGDDKPEAQVVTEGSNEKGHEAGQKPGSLGWKEEGCGSKRKHPDSPVGGPNDGPILNGLFTTSKRRVDMFTADEQEIVLNEIDPIMQSIRTIMHHKGYNDGDPLSADDQTYILENVLNHHPEKAQKMGAGVDYIMVSKHMKFQGSRCFYVVSTDGRKEDFSYHKCLKNFVSEKYPNKLGNFIRKYFKNS